MKGGKEIDKSFLLTLLTPIDKIVIDIKGPQLSYTNLINIVERYTKIPPQRICLLVGKQKLDKTSIIDLRSKNIVNVFVKGCGGAGDSIESEKTCVICKSKNSFRYRKVKNMSQEKINAIEAMASERLSVDEDQICSKCERNVARKLTKSDSEPAKKKRASIELCYLNKIDMCSSSVTKTTNLLNIPVFCELFGIGVENLEPNQTSMSLCDEHYYKYYFHINSCKLCSVRLQQGSKRKIPPESMPSVLSCYETLYPDKNSILTTEDNVCSNCYFLSRTLLKDNKSDGAPTNLDLNSIINKLTETTCLDKNRTALNKCIIFVAKKFLNNEAVLFPEVYDLYLSKPVVSSSDTKIDESDTQYSNCSRWALMSSLSSALSNHIAFHKLPSNKHGVLLYRKGSDVLASLHNVLYRERLRLKKLTETEGLHNLSLSLSEEALLFEAAMILNNLVMCQAESSLKPRTDKIDIAKISLASLITETDSRLWNFICLVTMNQTLRKKVEKQCGVDWSTRLDSCDES